jgi:hypothetical protein
MADTTTVGTEGAFTAGGDLPGVVAVGTWGWWDVLEAILNTFSGNHYVPISIAGARGRRGGR